MTHRRATAAWLALALLARAGSAGPTATELFAADLDPAMRGLTLSPTGTYAAVILSPQRLLVYHVPSRSRVKALDLSAQLAQVLWSGDDTLLVLRDAGSSASTAAIQLRFDGGRLERTIRWFNTPGQVVDSLPAQVGWILYAPETDRASVYRVQLSALFSAETNPVVGPRRDAGQFVAENRVANLLEPDILGVHWIPDHHGHVRAALSSHGKASEKPVLKLWARDAPDAAWRLLASGPADEFDLSPLGFAEDDFHLLVATRRDRDTVGLFELDPATGQLGSLRYEHPSAEIVRVVFDYSGRDLLSVAYFEGGSERYHHFRNAMKRHQEKLENAFAGEVVAIVNGSRDERLLSLFVSSAVNPGAFYIFDVEASQAYEVGQVAPWLEARRMVPVRAFRVDSVDGLEVEGLLAQPPGAARPPLVVLPHGGPIGVRDRNAFDPTVQFLAGRGYAVLQVNYRGSSGYGRAFEEAGFREWGGHIEDDIEAAVAHVVGQGWVDRDRACIVGGSYGGYSALMSSLRFPSRYRCAATLSGITDIALWLHSTEFEGTMFQELARDLRAQIAGDPEADYDALRATSPVYRAAEIPVPIFIAHGLLDRRVDIEHALRLRRMLDLYQKPYEWQVVEDAGHGFRTVEQAAAWCERLERFLAAHLRDGAPATGPDHEPEPGVGSGAGGGSGEPARVRVW